MIPDKEGYWWYSDKNGGVFIARVTKNIEGNFRHWIPGYANSLSCDSSGIAWLGPVNPEPMKVSGE